MSEEEKKLEKDRLTELVEATMEGYRLAQEHFEKYGKFLGQEKAV